MDFQLSEEQNLIRNMVRALPRRRSHRAPQNVMKKNVLIVS